MIAVSSFRPHAGEPDYAKNQIRARRSWIGCFDAVHYFGEREPELETPEHPTVFIGSDWPSIRAMALHAVSLPGHYVAILNADLVISPLIKSVEQRMIRIGLPAATSYRYEFDPNQGQISRIDAIRNRKDRGMDIFIATPQIWQGVAEKVPAYLRIGHQTWDTWVCGHFCSTLGIGFQQFTDEKLIFHPRHEGRKTPHQAEIRNDDPCFTLAHQPPPMPI